MRRLILFCLTVVLLSSCFTEKNARRSKENEEKDGYDNALIRGLQEAEKIMDPALGFVPSNRLYDAIIQTEALKNTPSIERTYLPLTWEERGPVYDSVGPSNGNGRGGGGSNRNLGGFTSGRIRAFLIDFANDPSGNTAFCGGVAGGVWKCTNFLSTEPNWAPINDNFSNLAVSSICQDPTNPQIFYFSTGEPTSNSDAVYGKGVWKSTDGGNSFTFLPATANFLRNYKIGCDAAGNVYLACRITTIPVAQSQGLFRSTDGGSSWTNITPNDLIATNNTCTDFGFSASGNLNATFGYLASNNIVNQRYSTNPSMVTPSTWSAGSGFRVTSGAIRTKLAVEGDVLYAITVNTSYNTDSCYRSVDGGATWTKQNTTVLPGGLGSQQGWYNLSMAINPSNPNELIAGGLDAYRSTNGGANWTKFTNWVSTSPYVHADHHHAEYWIEGGETRMIMASDGGIFYSDDNGATFKDKNKNLGIKQFYSAAIHPTAGSPYLLAGAQDNGTHQLNNPGLGYSIEVTGGDGAFVHINQLNPSIQFGAYVYNQYRRSTNGGASWSSINPSTTVGLFINPFDYDDAQNIMYASNGPLSQIRRWPNANTSSTTSNITFSSATLGGTTISLTTFKVSPYTTNRVFFGTNNGRVFRLENANTVLTATVDANTTNIGSSSFPIGYVSCVNTGTDDNNLVAVFSNYGVNNVWVTKDGGSNWTAIDGNLPDMPVRWALFEPGSNDKLYLATEAGIYTTTKINGGSTEWLPENGFPSVRTDMLKIRMSDSTIVAGTHGRGLWTAKIPPCGNNYITDQPQNVTVCAGDNASFSVVVDGPQSIYQWQVSTNGGGSYTDIPGATSATLTLTNVTAGMNGNKYRSITDTYCSGLLNSEEPTLTVYSAAAITTCTNNIIVSNNANQCGAIVNYPAVVVGGSPSPVVTYSTPSGSFFPIGTTTVNVSAITSCGTANCSFTVTVNDTQAPSITCPTAIVRSTDPNLCTASIVTPNPTTADNCAVTVLTWNMSGATTGSSPATGINNLGTRTFNIGVTTVNYSVKDAAGNTTNCTYTITVNDGQLPVISQQPVNKTVCNGSNATFSVTVSNALSYQWQSWTGTTWVDIIGANTSSYALSNVSIAQNTNSYRVLINGRCITLISNFVTLYVNPLPDVKLQASIPPELLPTQNLTISAIVTPSGGNFVWYKNGVVISGAIGSSLTNLTVDNAGVYKVVYTDANGCTTTSSNLEITAKASATLYVYPNPNSGQFQVRFYNQPGEKATIRVFDAKGSKVYEKSIATSLAYTRLDVDLRSTLGSGVYIVELVNEQGKTIGANRIIVKK